MPHALETLPPLCCPPGGGNDLVSLLVVLSIIGAAYVTTQWLRSRKGGTNMKWKNVAIVVLLILAVAVVFALKQNHYAVAEHAPLREAVPTTSAVEISSALPRLLDLGADKCIPCKMMAPILDDLKTTYAGRMQVEFIDVWKDPDAGAPYDIRVIPTQILFDSEGKELFRHEGFFAKDDILAKWKELGFEFK